MEYLGGAAGAGLGYIVGGTQGALKGATTGYNLTKNIKAAKQYMQTPNSLTKRRNSTGGGLAGPPVKRRLSNASSMSGVSYNGSRRSSTSSNLRFLKTEKPVVQYATTVRVKKVKRSFKGKAKKKVKVSKKLRSKINKVLEAKKIYGSGRVLILGGNSVAYGATGSKQIVFPLPMPQSGNSQKGVLFDRRFLMYVASRLFNGRLASDSTMTLGKYSDILFEDSANWSNFSKNLATIPSAFKVTVANLKAKITIKNNTGRTQYLKMYECKPKYQRKDENGYGSGNGYAIGDWDKALEYDAKSVVKGSNITFGGSGGNSKASTINLPLDSAGTRTVTINTLYNSPKLCKSWSQQWSYNETSIILEPGQVHVQWVQGDVGDYDFSKYYTTAADGTIEFNNIGKTDRHIFFTNVPEMASVSSSGVSGRLTSSNGGDRLLFETEIYCSMNMPETTGLAFDSGVSPSAIVSTILPLTNRHRTYFVDTFYDQDAAVSFTSNFDDNTTTRQSS